MVNNNSNINLSAPFASSAASGQTAAAGQNGDSSNKLVSETIIADGEWHYFMVTPQEANTTFVANQDGTYSWSYLRIRFNTFAAYDGSCYIDIAEIAFADNLEAAENYIGKNEKALPLYVGNLDKNNVTIDGVNDVTESVRGTRAPIALDLEQRTLTTPTSLKMGGWLCTPGGVSSYKIRVTKVNGEAVAEPTLVDWVNGANRSDIYTAAGKGFGYSDACALGAGFGSSVIDLTAYMGSTVDFEIVGITNYGVEIVVVTVANVEVPVAPNYVIDAKALSGNTDYTGSLGLSYALSDDGQYVTYTQPANNEAPGGGLYAYITFPSENINTPKNPTGEYVMLKYRTTYNDRIEIFVGANNGSQTAIGSVDNFSLAQAADNTGSLIADGEWHYVIMNVNEIIADFNKPQDAFAPEDGTEDTYILDYLRIDFFNNPSGDEAKTFDLAAVAYSDSIDKFVEYYGITAYTYVDGYQSGVGVIYETVTVNAAE